MDNLNVIDRFTETFVTYIETGFGLLQGDVAFLVSILVALDIVLAGLFWALSEDGSVIAQLLRKVLYIGTFALIINNFASLADIVFASFAGLGLKAGAAPFGPDQLMRPGFVAETGFTASWPLLEAAGELIGFTTVFDNLVTIIVLLLSWAIVLLAFFILSVQLFVTIVEFKLVTLAGFVLVPFALFGKTAFLAERVLGHVITAGIKLMVLAIVVAIGSTLFGEIATPADGEITLIHAASIILAAIAVFGLAVFVPGIAAGLVSGAPQLGAGAVAGTAIGLAGAGAATSIAATGTARLAGSTAGGAVRAAASLSGRVATGHERGGFSGIARATVAGPVANAAARMTAPVRGAFREGQAEAFRATQPASPATSGRGAGAVTAEQPAWARALTRRARLRDAGMASAHALKDGDRSAAGDHPRLDPDP